MCENWPYKLSAMVSINNNSASQNSVSIHICYGVTSGGTLWALLIKT